MAEGTLASDRESQDRGTTPKPRKWFHFRGRVLLVIPAALLILTGVYAPRQLAQRRALVALKAMNAPVRTQPFPIPGIGQLFGEDYAQEITDVYMRNPEVSDEDLHILAGLKTLQKLELAGSSVTSAGIEKVDSLHSVQRHHYFELRRTD